MNAPQSTATLTRSMTTGERWREFHTNNPHVYDLIVRYCREVRDSGQTRFGIRQPWERMRYRLDVETKRAAGDWKLNDHYTSYYARLVVRQEADLAELLSLRDAPDADQVVAEYLADRDADEYGRFSLFPEQRS